MENLGYNRVLFILIIFLIPFLLTAQSKLGFEIRSSYNKTFNTDKLVGFGHGYAGNLRVEERDLFANSFSVGVLYSLSHNTTLKLHLGRHQNGRIISLFYVDDVSTYEHINVDIPVNYFQIVPSVSYHFNYKKFRFPIEVGIRINKSILEDKVFYLWLNEYNFDLRSSIGFSYQIFDNMILGANMLMSRALNDYQSSHSNGHYIPLVIGVELSVQYSLNGILKNK